MIFCGVIYIGCGLNYSMQNLSIGCNTEGFKLAKDSLSDYEIDIISRIIYKPIRKRLLREKINNTDLLDDICRNVDMYMLGLIGSSERTQKKGVSSSYAQTGMVLRTNENIKNSIRYGTLKKVIDKIDYKLLKTTDRSQIVGVHMMNLSIIRYCVYAIISEPAKSTESIEVLIEKTDLIEIPHRKAIVYIWVARIAMAILICSTLYILAIQF